MKKRLLSLIVLVPFLASCGGGSEPSVVVSSSEPAINSSEEISSSSYLEESSEEISSSSEEESSEEIERDLLDFDDFDNVIERYNEVKETTDGKTIVAGDPYIYRFDGKYYLYMTGGYGALRCYSSVDLLEWDLEGTCFDGNGYDAKDGGAIYAPEVRYYDGLFYMIFRGSSSGLYVATSERPVGPFKAKRLGDYGEIDQSYFINSNEDIYVYCSGLGLHLYEADAMDHLVGDAYVIPQAKVDSGWTEGPYVLERYGKCYLTYTGNDYRNDYYRVDYVYIEDDSNMMNMSSYSNRKATVVVNTEEDFAYLGHSMTMLGPDLDSYYIVYHNSYTGRGGYGENRRFNYSRLSFDGSMMKADAVRKGMIQDIYNASYFAEDGSELKTEGNFLLSDIASKNEFSVEYTNIGNGRMIFSYVDELNYGYLDYEDNELIIGAIDNGKDKLIKEVELIKEYDPEVYHTFRLQYSNEEISLYFDDIEKLGKVNIGYSFSGGKAGYLKNNTFEEICHLSMSDVAHGSSDSIAYHEDFNYASDYDRHLSILSNESGLQHVTSKNDFARYDGDNLKLAKKGDRATYRMVAYEEGYYQVGLRVTNPTIGKTVSLKIDDGAETPYKIGIESPIAASKVADSYVVLTTIYLSAGPHHISLVAGDDEVVIGEITYDRDVNLDDLEIFPLTEIDGNDFFLRNANQFDNGLMMNASGACVGICSRTNYSCAETEVKFVTSGTSVNNTFGLLINCNAFGSRINDGDRERSYQGMYFSISGNDFNFEKCDFTSVELLGQGAYKKFDAGVHTLKIKQINNQFICSFDGEEIYNVVVNLPFLAGGVGVFAKDANVLVTGLSVTI